MIGVAILGYGTVGSGVQKILSENRGHIARMVGDEVRLTHVVDIRPLSNMPPEVVVTQRYEDVLEADEVKIVVECIGGAVAAYEFTRRALESGRSVVTSNKELVSTKGDELLDIARAHSAMYLYEASVGGGIPLLRPISQCLRANHILGVDGIVNGSTNYLLTRMEREGVSFPAALGEAQRLGYAENNPAADIEGWDARRKLAILAHVSFGARLSDEALIPTTGISSLTPDDLRCARAFDGAVKLIAHARVQKDQWNGWVSPAVVDCDSPLYGVSDVFNAIMVHGDCVGDCMFYGRGAGSLPTASAVVGDVIDAAQHLNTPKQEMDFEVIPAFTLDKEARANWLVRVMGADQDTRKRVQEALNVEKMTELESVSGEKMTAVRTSPMNDLEADQARARLEGLAKGSFIRFLR